MRKISRDVQDIPLTLLIVLLPLSGLVSCASLANGPFSSNNQQHVVIDWVDFIRFGGITYVAASPKPGHTLAESDLGPVFATVTFKLDGHVQDPGYQSKDGDAAFLDAGTKVYTVKGYRPTFRLATFENHTLTLYEADTNPRARTGADLLDIGRKVHFIGIASEQNGVTELGAIKDPKKVNLLVTLVLEAPVDQNHLAGKKQYFITFHLVDGTVVTRAYWLDTGVLARGILLPKAFELAIQAALSSSLLASCRAGKERSEMLLHAFPVLPLIPLMHTNTC